MNLYLMKKEVWKDTEGLTPIKGNKILQKKILFFLIGLSLFGLGMGLSIERLHYLSGTLIGAVGVFTMIGTVSYKDN